MARAEFEKLPATITPCRGVPLRNIASAVGGLDLGEKTIVFKNIVDRLLPSLGSVPTISETAAPWFQIWSVPRQPQPFNGAIDFSAYKLDVNKDQSIKNGPLCPDIS